jgi:2,4-dienoyl-CoA reductase-like NADH-dependent reductase (Old Yellow Enzyme family)
MTFTTANTTLRTTMTLFDTHTLAGMTLRNRIVRSATWEGLCDDTGAPTDKFTSMMVDLARGGTGLIISSHAYVRPVGKASPQQLGIYDDSQVDSLSAMTAAIHDAGGIIVCQLAHAGGEALQELTDMPPLAPSTMTNEKGDPANAMTDADIQDTITAFGDGARRAKQAGFDGVQIHAAHGYLISQFLSPFFNKRTDTYGGSLENRARFLREVHTAIRAEVGTDYPVMAKINSSDFMDDGFTEAEMVETVQMLATAGLDAIELSGGTRYSGECPPIRRGDSDGVYYRDIAIRCRAAVDIPIMLVGGIRDLTTANALLADGACDYIALSRPLIAQPNLPLLWERGDVDQCECVSCTMCFLPAFKGEGIACVQLQRRAKREARKAERNSNG